MIFYKIPEKLYLPEVITSPNESLTTSRCTHAVSWDPLLWLPISVFTLHCQSNPKSVVPSQGSPYSMHPQQPWLFSPTWETSILLSPQFFAAKPFSCIMSWEQRQWPEFSRGRPLVSIFLILILQLSSSASLWSPSLSANFLIILPRQ